MTLGVDFYVETDEKYAKAIKDLLENHIEYVINLSELPEITEVHDVEVRVVEEE